MAGCQKKAPKRGRWGRDDPTNGAKETLGFTEKGVKYGQPKQSVGSQRKTWAWVISNDQFPNRLATPAHPWAADVHPYVGRWVVPMTQGPLSELPQTTRCQKLPVPYGELVLAQLAVVGFSTLLERA